MDGSRSRIGASLARRLGFTGDTQPRSSHRRELLYAARRVVCPTQEDRSAREAAIAPAGNHSSPSSHSTVAAADTDTFNRLAGHPDLHIRQASPGSTDSPAFFQTELAESLSAGREQLCDVSSASLLFEQVAGLKERLSAAARADDNRPVVRSRLDMEHQVTVLEDGVAD